MKIGKNDIIKQLKEKIDRKFNIDVCPRTKKNSSQIIFAKGRPMLIPSKLYKQFEQDCLKQITNKYQKKINYPVNVKALFYMPTRRRVDLTNLLEALDDMFVKAEVLEDDCRDIIAGHDGSRVYWDKENPHIEVEITEMDNYEQWKE